MFRDAEVTITRAGAVPGPGHPTAGQLAVLDVRPLQAGDTSGISLFFFLIVCTLGGFLTVTANGLAAAALRPRYRWPLFLAAAVATPTLGYLLGGQGLGAISGSAGAVFALLGVAALLVLIVTMIARGLQLILGAIGTLFAGLAVFFLLNFPSSAPVSKASCSRLSGTS